MLNLLWLQLISETVTAGELPIAIEDDSSQIQTISIVSSKDPDWKPYRTMLLGLDAFDRHHDLAPGTALRFVLRPQQVDLTVAGVTLRIAGNQTSIDVPIATNGTFSLPRNQPASDENADLVLNKKKGLFRWRPDIRSTGVPVNARRLGDLRLECEVRWAVEKGDLSFVQRTLFHTLGGPCKTSSVNVLYLAPGQLSSATLISGERRESLPINRLNEGGHFFSPPIYDKSWPDDTLVEFEFIDPTTTM